MDKFLSLKYLKIVRSKNLIIKKKVITSESFRRLKQILKHLPLTMNNDFISTITRRR